ncbi:MAG: stage II sporulation protein M [Methanothrix sp.]|jgi:stage II sporulation protein M|uniref:stage II sporulation protein M n=1 Tax=Methanothrix sp. TaxID=90426 RepID=UPI001BD2AC19|nr:stage II sporulation protein M [Methanothrix sp.]MBK7386154.1 stage II sporulation protein M [Methanothrix sp.]HPW72396.1 stage II sporulation protein M [Methanothrix sp.]
MSIKEDASYLRSIYIYIAISVLLFALTAVMGYYTAHLDPEFAASWTEEMKIQSLIQWILGQPPLMIMMIIFLKNLLASAAAILLGLGLGIVPMMVATSNGFLLGIVGYSAVEREGWLYLAAGILPHGIIELPAVLLSIAIGLRLGHVLLLSLLKERADLSGEVRVAIRLLLRWIMPLLLLAAAIETFITPFVISRVA